MYLNTSHSGEFVWAKTFGGTGSDFGWSIGVHVSGSVYIAGGYQGTVDFDPGTGTDNRTSAGGRDIFVMKLGSIGGP